MSTGGQKETRELRSSKPTASCGPPPAISLQPHRHSADRGRNGPNRARNLLEAGLVERNIEGDIEAIADNVQVIRSKFQPLLDSDQYVEDVAKLVEVIPQMLDNVEEMVLQLNKAFEILRESPRK